MIDYGLILIHYTIILILLVVAAYALWDMLFLIRTAEIGIIERCGKFNRTAFPGLRIKWPFIEKLKFHRNVSYRWYQHLGYHAQKHRDKRILARFG